MRNIAPTPLSKHMTHIQKPSFVGLYKRRSRQGIICSLAELQHLFPCSFKSRCTLLYLSSSLSLSPSVNTVTIFCPSTSFYHFLTTNSPFRVLTTSPREQNPLLRAIQIRPLTCLSSLPSRRLQRVSASFDAMRILWKDVRIVCPSPTSNPHLVYSLF